LRIAYTPIAIVYDPLWLTKETGLYKKYNLVSSEVIDGLYKNR